MTFDDELDTIMEVMEASFDPHWREAWNRRQVSDSLLLPNTYAILVDERGANIAPGARAAGFLLARRAPGEEELLLVAVRPESRRRGIGRRLIDMFVEEARANGSERIFLEMRARNPAGSLYHALGFRPIGTRKDYYRTMDGTTVDAITFGRSV